MRAFKNARQVFVQSHYTWAEAIQKDMRDITLALKDYKYVKDAIDLCGALGLNSWIAQRSPLNAVDR